MPKKNYKLTTAQRHEVARRYAAGETGVALANEFGITVGSVYRLVVRRGKRRRPVRVPWVQTVEHLRAAGKITGVIPRIAN